MYWYNSSQISVEEIVVIKELSKYFSEGRTARDLKITDCELNSVVFNGLSADGIEFARVRFSQSEFRKVSWRNVLVSDTQLEEVSFENAVLRMCKLQNVRAINCNFSSAKIENINAQGCAFDGSSLKGASLTDGDWNRSSFIGADLTDTDASYCNMRGVDFGGAILVGTNFQDTDLRGADFRSAKLENVNFDGAVLTGAVFDEESMTERASGSENTAAFRDMVGALGPTISGLLNKTAGQGLLDSSKAQSEFEEIMKSIGVSSLDISSDAKFDEKLGDILSTVSSVGIGPLMEALQQQGDRPSEEVAKMLENLSTDMKLDESATTQELLSSLVSKFTGK